MRGDNMPGCERLLLAVFLWAAIVSVIFSGGTWGYRESSASGRNCSCDVQMFGRMSYRVSHPGISAAGVKEETLPDVRRKRLDVKSRREERGGQEAAEEDMRGDDEVGVLALQICDRALYGSIIELPGFYLFDKLLDSLRGKMRLDTLKLITNIVHKQPSWLHCITSHKILSQILGIIKHGDQEPTHIMLANVIVISLMPMLPMQFGTSVLLETFEAFSSLAALCTRKPSHILDTHLSYLRLGLQTLFQHLYGMYPCNFLAYLRGYYGSQDHSRENFAIYTKTIRVGVHRAGALGVREKC
ncbi:hypothetical protein HPB47_008832 [Ixodes persulcatus]|uniref:Uncharacterized protein n=1 Tax=Ixodes persulcatus TaxID=34615 RepID=A0AC60P3L7_IXOPE|nr:hypothetical protein HPB47_008832 [Ixodes persulcatus]